MGCGASLAGVRARARYGAMTVAGQRRALTGLPHFKPGLRAPGTRDLEAELWPLTGLPLRYHESIWPKTP